MTPPPRGLNELQKSTSAAVVQHRAQLLRSAPQPLGPAEGRPLFFSSWEHNKAMKDVVSPVDSPEFEADLLTLGRPL